MNGGALKHGCVSARPKKRKTSQALSRLLRHALPPTGRTLERASSDTLPYVRLWQHPHLG